MGDGIDVAQQVLDPHSRKTRLDQCAESSDCVRNRQRIPAMEFELAFHDRGERVLLHIACSDADYSVKLPHQRGNDLVLLLEQTQLRIDGSPVFRPSPFVINKIREGDVVAAVGQIQTSRP